MMKWQEAPRVAPQIQFVLGGARSGKSSHAEALAQTRPDTDEDAQRGDQRLIYIATAEIFDAEMESRVELHRQRRGPEWVLVEAPVDLPRAIRDSDDGKAVILVDCLSVWTTNLLIHERDIEQARQALIDTLRECKGRIILPDASQVAMEELWQNNYPNMIISAVGADHAGFSPDLAADDPGV